MDKWNQFIDYVSSIGSNDNATSNQRVTQNNRNHGISNQNYNNNASNHYGNNSHRGSRQSKNQSRSTRGNNGYYNNYDPYANNGRQNNNSRGRHQHQAQKQSFVKNKRQQIAQTQTFIEQVENAVLCITLAGKAYHDGQDAETVDLLCDSAVVSLNMFAVSCQQLHQENNKDALDLGKHRVHVQFAELKSKNKAIHKLIEPHRNFINAALNGQKNLRYKKDRVDATATELFKQDPDKINKAYADMIRHQQEFDKSREALLEEKTNEKYAKQHQSELNEYRKNNKKSKNKASKPGPKYNRAKISDLYFTKTGKSAKFVDAEAVERAKKEKQAMDQDIFGSVDVYDDILPKIRFTNAALKWTKQNKWKGISTPMPCQILVPKKKDRENQDKNTILVRPCYPFNNCTLLVGVDLLELDEDEIKRIEQKQIGILEVTEDNIFNQNLGYKTIEEQERSTNYVDDDSNDDQEMM